MKKTYAKLQIRGVKTSLTRFLSIMGIVMIGTGFLAGLLATAPDMKMTVDAYYDENRILDLDVKGTLGVTDADAEAVRAVEGVACVMPARVTDAIMEEAGGTSYVTRLYGVPLAQRGEEGFLNDFVLVSGRMPERRDECLLLCPSTFTQSHALGEAYTLSPENPDYEDRADVYAVETYTVCGIVKSPYNMTTESEPASVGAGKVEVFLFVDESCYAYDDDVYTDLYVTASGAAEMDAFSEGYQDRIDVLADALEPLGEARSEIRFASVKDEAQEEIDDAQAELDDAEADADRELGDARKKLDDAQVDLADAHQKLDDARADLDKGQKQYKYAHMKYYQQKNALPGEIEKQRNDVRNAYNAGLLPDEAAAHANSAIDYAEEEAERELAEAYKKLQNAKKDLEEGEAEIKDHEAELADAEKDLADAEKEYADSERDTRQKIADAQQKLDDAQQELDDLDMPEWKILDRTDVISYASYKSNTEKIDAIAKVFPIFLFVVAALVALTTMTRMVEEERTQIGTLKALGYSNGSILAYYVGYSMLASLLGCALGMLLGFSVLPKVISQAYTMMYTIPPILLEFRWGTALLISPIAVLCTTLATLWACLSELTEKPSLLMLPRAPEAGKRIFLERVGFLWKRLKFTQKVTCRNIFRYKKRLYMTMIGIAGCTALLLTGFGLHDSINDIVEKQFGELYRYDLTVYLKDEDSLTDNAALAAFFNESGKIDGYAAIHSENGKVRTATASEKTNIYVAKDQAALKEQIVLRERKTGADVPFTKDSAVLTEKMCETLGLAVGDAFTLENDAGERAELRVTGIVENYVTSYTFISADTYDTLFQTRPEYNRVIATVSAGYRGEEDAITAELLADDDVSLVQFNESIQASFDHLIGNINYIVYVLIVAAGALAMIVLYNLTNINISERKKELATIKVLGFYEREVAGYIYRETTILSILGTLLGFGFGVWLHAFVIKTAEVDAVMFGRVLYARSFLLSAAVTMLFTGLVDLIMTPRIRGIDMVESMKAND